ncbi:MAG: T9SS type A sorting domain-containing protein, partial [Bacteroidota bacterium]
NTIEVNTNTFGSGIRINDSKANGQIENNSIDLLQAGHGIYLSFAENCIVFDNTINMLDPLQANYGIYLAGVTKCAITENTISGSGTTGNGNVGLRIIFSPGNTYCCNNFDQTQVGTYVLGPSSATNQFKGNTFGTNGTDLLIDQNLNPNILQSVLGSQEHTQNQWVGNNSSAIYEGATPEFAQQFPFFVDLSSNPNFLPNVVTPIGWFDNTPSTGILAPCPEESCLSIEAIDLNEPDIIKIVNNGSVIPYIEVVRWELRRFLYRDIKGRNSSNSIINSFKAAASNNTIGGFEEVDNGVRKIYSFSPTNISLTESHIDQTLSDLDALQAIDDQLVSAVGANFNSLSNSREQLIESSALNSLALGASQQNLRTGRGERATLLHPINSTIATLTTFEENEKVINEDVLSYFQNGELSTSSLARLQAIAYQCPFEGGLAVYRAQALLRRITNKAIEFPDNFDCLSNNSIQGMANGAFTNTSSNTIQVFPNPSTHEATVSWSIPIQQQGQLVLYDMIGKPIEQIPLEIGMEQQRFSVQNLPSGIYLLHVQIDGKSEVIKLLHN